MSVLRAHYARTLLLNIFGVYYVNLFYSKHHTILQRTFGCKASDQEQFSLQSYLVAAALQGLSGNLPFLLINKKVYFPNLPLPWPPATKLQWQ